MNAGAIECDLSRLPTDISQVALTDFWNQFSCVVEVIARGNEEGKKNIRMISLSYFPNGARASDNSSCVISERKLDTNMAPSS